MLNPLSNIDWLWQIVGKSLNTLQRGWNSFMLLMGVYRKTATLSLQFLNSKKSSSSCRKHLYCPSRSSATLLDPHYFSVNFDNTISNVLVHSSGKTIIFWGFRQNRLLTCSYFKQRWSFKNLLVPWDINFVHSILNSRIPLILAALFFTRFARVVLACKANINLCCCFVILLVQYIQVCYLLHCICWIQNWILYKFVQQLPTHHESLHQET